MASTDEVVGVLFRMSPQERRALRAAAAQEGFATMQQLLEQRVFGAAKPLPRRGRPPRRRLQRELPLTG